MQPGSVDPVPCYHHSTHPLLATKKQQVLVRPSHMQRRFPKPGGLETDVRLQQEHQQHTTNSQQKLEILISKSEHGEREGELRNYEK